MRILKRLDAFILKAYLQLFAGTFFVCLFVYMMQFTWRYIDELIGKGLSTEVLMQFFWYTGLTLVPISLPLGILLASLITFGNMGERLELLSMKAAGIPLLRILTPVFFFVVILTGCSFYFQNNIGPEATKQLAALVWTMKQKSPELDIPEGQFYSEIPGYNLYVEKKDTKTGMLYGVMIYSTAGGYEDTQIVLADSGRLQTTADKTFLQLTLYNGERFRNMDAHSGNMMRASVPYMRETFSREVDLIPFDGNFNVMDASLFASNAATKNITMITNGIDSLNHRIDSTGHALYASQLTMAMVRGEAPASKRDSVRVAKAIKESLPFDTLFARLSIDQQRNALRNAQSKVSQLKAEYDFRQLISNEDCAALRLHFVEWHKKYTLSVACLIFFFIGAPLGAIIRKGGLGVPVIISVLIFIFYYIINVSGEKMAKSGQWFIPFGVWLSSMVLAPIGTFLTVKANKDSVVFNIEGYRRFFMRLFGLRETRKLNRKEVIIETPDYPRIVTDLQTLSAQCRAYSERYHLLRLPSYWRIFFRYRPDTQVRELNDQLETLINELHNSTDNMVLRYLNEYPIINPDAHTRPFQSARLNAIAGMLLPVGLFFWFYIWRFRLRLHRDLKEICDISDNIINRITTKIINEPHESQ
ncbi:MAG: YjgP/YjgQ family permease [Bacteroidaceae bacterium]|nr:YjgP/YjgQ family permease [Bacteroidaceae bacterium]